MLRPGRWRVRAVAAAGGDLARSNQREFYECKPDQAISIADEVHSVFSISGNVALVGSWSLLKGDADQLVLRHDVSVEEPAREGAKAEAAGMSDLLG